MIQPKGTVADRITARPSTKDYGALSVWIQSQCRAEIVRTLPPTVFWPRPKVTSAIIHIELDEQLLQLVVRLRRENRGAPSMKHPPRVDPGDVCCKWQFSMRDEDDPEYVPVELSTKRPD